MKIKKIYLEKIMEKAIQAQKEDLIERAMAVGFDPEDPMTMLVVDSLRARKFDKATELADGNA